MDRRIVVSVMAVAGLATALTLGSAFFTSDARADGAKTRAKGAPELAQTPNADVPPPAVPLTPPKADATTPGAPPIAQAPVPGYTPPAYPTTPAVNEARDGSLTVQEILQLRGLKKRIGGENLKRVVDALAD